MGTVSADVVLEASSRVEGKDGRLRKGKNCITEFYCTGFSKFHSVSVNPTELTLRGMSDYLSANPLQEGCILSSSKVLKVAAQSAGKELEQLYHSINSRKSFAYPQAERRAVVIHFGVNVRVSSFQLELQARNEATFSCPDEMGWAPIKQRVCPTDGDMSVIRQTTLPIEALVATLKSRGFKVEKSTDAGRFICNWVYYTSLREASKLGTIALFVHVPPASVAPIEEQRRFARGLFHVISELPLDAC